MINQKPISLKIDCSLLEDLDAEVATGWRKRNSHINEAIRFYLEYLDTRRRMKSYGSADARQQELKVFVRKWFPDAVAW